MGIDPKFCCVGFQEPNCIHSICGRLSRRSDEIFRPGIANRFRHKPIIDRHGNKTIGRILSRHLGQLFFGTAKKTTAMNHHDQRLRMLSGLRRKVDIHQKRCRCTDPIVLCAIDDINQSFDLGRLELPGKIPARQRSNGCIRSEEHARNQKPNE